MTKKYREEIARRIKKQSRDSGKGGVIDPKLDADGHQIDHQGIIARNSVCVSSCNVGEQSTKVRGGDWSNHLKGPQDYESRCRSLQDSD